MMRGLYRLLKELTRRKMIGAMSGYALAAWVTVEATSVVLPAFDAPSWILRYVIILVLAFTPVALIISWKFNLTVRGFVLTSDLGAIEEQQRKQVPVRDLSQVRTVGKEQPGGVRGSWAEKNPLCIVYPAGKGLVSLIRDLVGRSVKIVDAAICDDRYAVIVDCLESTAEIQGARESHLGQPLVAVVPRSDSPQAMAALGADVNGIICLTDPAATWRDCVNVVLGGGRWFGGPGVEVCLDHKCATYEVARGVHDGSDITVRTRAFVRDFVRDGLQR